MNASTPRRFRWADLPRTLLAVPVGVVEWLHRRRRARSSPEAPAPTWQVAAFGDWTYGPLPVVVTAARADDLRALAALVAPSLTIRPGEPPAPVDVPLAVGPTAHHVHFDHTGAGGRDLVVTLDGGPVPGDTPAIAIRALLSMLDLMVLEAEAELAHLHAGLVAVDGRGVLVPAASGSGKSNLIAALAPGNALATDEVVTVDRAASSLRAAIRPVCLKSASHGRARALAPHAVAPESVEPWLLSAEDLGARPIDAAPPGIVVVPDRSGTAGATPLSPAQTLEVLIAQSFDVDVDPARRLDDLAWLAATAPAWRLGYVEAADAVAVVVELVRSVGDDPPAPHEWAAPPAPRGTGGGARRAPQVLSVVFADGAVLWDPGSQQVVRLNASGAALWTSLDGVPGAVSDATSGGSDEGAHDRGAAFDQLVEELAALGMVVRG